MNKISPRYDELSPERRLFINNLINSLASEPDRDPLDVIADRHAFPLKPHTCTYSRFILHRDYQGDAHWVEPTIDALVKHLHDVCDIWLTFTDVPVGFTLVKKEEV